MDSKPRKGSAVSTVVFVTAWLAERELAATTREHHAQLLRDHIEPTFGDEPVTAITPTAVRTWHAGLARRTGPTARAHAYGLLRTMLATAVADELLAANPCRVRGGGRAKRVKRIQPATLAELEALVAAMPERYRVMVLLASWCGLRFGELAELRRSDVDVKAGTVHVRRGMVRTSSGRVVKGPKSDAGRRDVTIPPHLLPAVADHLKRHAQLGAQGLLFPPATASTWCPPRSTACSTRPGRQPACRICASTTCATPGRRWRLLRARRWRN
jgi:integrase